MTLRELQINLVKSNAIVLRYQNESLSLCEMKFNNRSDFNKYFYTEEIFTKIADAEIIYIEIESNGRLVIRI